MGTITTILSPSSLTRLPSFTYFLLMMPLELTGQPVALLDRHACSPVMGSNLPISREMGFSLVAPGRCWR